MHSLFLVYFVNPYMFGVYIGPSSGGTTVSIQQLIFFILFRWLYDNRQSSKRNNKYQLLYTYGLRPDYGPRNARNMLRWTKYTKNKLYSKLVFLYTITSKCTVNKT